MEEEIKYNLTDEVLVRADIKGAPQDMIEWLDNLPIAEKEDWYMIATRQVGNNSTVELTEAMFKAIVLLSYELDTMELALTAAKANDITKIFLLNIVLYKGREEGFYNIKSRLSLIFPPEIELTELGKEVAKKL